MREKCPQKFIQSRDERPKKKQREKRKLARLKTQKGGLGKIQGQRKEEEEEEKKKLEDPTNLET